MDFKGIDREEKLGNISMAEYTKYIELHRQTSEIPSFRVDDRYFVGNRGYWIRKYVKQNPSDKFIT